MRIAITGDTHMPKGRRELSSSYVERLRAAGAIVHTGDFTGIETLRLLESLGPPLHAVRGNVDSPEVAARLPETITVELAGARFGLIHDAGPRCGRLRRLRRRFPDADAVLFGHSHMPAHEQEGGFQIFNPGSPTERRRAPVQTIGIAEIGAGTIRFSLVEV